MASDVNFNDFWARDSFWASFGMLESGLDLDQVKKSLELFLLYQREDGKIPRKIVLDYNGLKYLGIKIKRKKPRPIYTSSIKWHFSVDDNLLLVIAFCKYIERTNDLEFAKKYYEQVKRALEFYSKKGLIRENLIHEVGFSNWEDTIYKKGFVLYTSCLWYEAVGQFKKIYSILSFAETQDFASLQEINIPLTKDILSQIQKLFWLKDEGYFADSVYKSNQQKYFDLAGNMLAILFDIATTEQAEKILRFVETNCNASLQDERNILHPINYPLYPWYRISPVLFLFNIQKYQNGISWSWVEVLLVAAEVKMGKIEQAKIHLENLSNVIIKNGHIHETYWLDGRPFNHLFWKSAVPFAWGAGLYLYALAKLEKSDLA